MPLDRFANHTWNSRHRLGRGTIHDTDAEQGAAFLHPAVVADSTLQKVLVGKDQLFSRDARQASRIQADRFHGPAQSVDRERIADDERFVEQDREGREQVSEDVLNGKRYGNSADPESGDQSGNVDAEILQQKQQCDRPDDDLQ